MKQLAIALILVLLTCPLLSAAAEDGLTAVDCAEEGFSTMIPADCTAKYTEGTGLQIFVENAGYIPYVIVSRRPADMQFSNPTGYLNNVYREYMENRYGDNMIGMNPAKDWQVGGKTLLSARYLYKVGETTVCLLHLIEIREDGDVEFSAKFVDGEDAKTMAALDAAVKYYTTGQAPAEQTDAAVIAPNDVSGQEVNTENGIYWAAITDTDRIESGGFFTAKLYLQDVYPAEDINGLAAGMKVRVNGQEFTVKSVVPDDEETIEIYTEEDFDGYIVFKKASDYFYTALVNDWVPCTHIADRKIMLPLANDFSFLWIDADESATVYDADSFIGVLDEMELSQYNTMLQYSGGLVMMVIHTSYPFGPEEG